jgi:8-oxo-dGTP pyrophosphatase MutT (NUDIX family)
MISFTSLKDAVELPDFDGFQAQLGMSPKGRERMMPNPANPPRQSAVLVLAYPQVDGSLHLLLTKRTDTLRGHSGQVSFPGGSIDPEDKSHEEAALREAFEEVGLYDKPRILGKLTDLWIPPSNFEVHPVVATLEHEPTLIANPTEVAKILHMPLSALLDPATKKSTTMDFRGTPVDVPYYDVDGHIVWGATAAMLSELELRLRQVHRF